MKIDFLYTILLDLVQVFHPGRTFNYYDILANFIGIVFGTVILVIYSKSRFVKLV